MKFRAALIALPFLVAACGNASSESSNGAGTAAPAGKKADILDTDMVLGDPNAPVTLIEYASVTCPHCATFNEQVMPDIKSKYIDTGKVKLIFREFPTAPAPYSIVGSVLARCAAEKSGPEAYFLITDALFRGQRNWIKDNPRDELVKIVGQAGMDEAALEACLERKELADIVNANAKGGMEKYDISGTPQFILDGEKMSYKSKEEFEQLVAAAVEKAGA
ncbi:MAG TPA: DsbA family protein [Parvularculaceae bacterium]|nr:DsbA family protein [Parvularculaceae bacterium]